MLAAFACSAVFLACYLWYHFHVGSVRFQKQGWIRPVYFTILLTHTILAVAVLPVILRSLYLAAKDRFEEHRRWARWAFPIWLYVSVTGVTVYWMLYRL
jgi:putative membrane protein